MKLFSGNAMWQLVMQSDWVTKVVLFILLFMSILCWTVFFYKIIVLKLKQKQLRDALVYLKKVTSFDDLRMMAAAFSKTLPGYVLSSNLGFLQAAIELYQDQDQRQQEAIELVHQHLDQTVDELVSNEELYLPVLSSCAAAAPLLGLFGTVWGLVHSFVDIAQKQSADITTVAPGIAEALITTLAGLVVAIPALIMFHYLQSNVRFMERQIQAIADQYAWHVQKMLVR